MSIGRGAEQKDGLSLVIESFNQRFADAQKSRAKFCFNETHYVSNDYDNFYSIPQSVRSKMKIDLEELHVQTKREVLHIFVGEADFMMFAGSDLPGNILICDINNTLLTYLDNLIKFLIEVAKSYTAVEVSSEQEKNSNYLMHKDLILKWLTKNKTLAGNETRSRTFPFDHWMMNETSFRKSMQGLVQREIRTLNISLFDSVEVIFFARLIDHMVVGVVNVTNLPDYDGDNKLQEFFNTIPTIRDITLFFGNMHYYGIQARHNDKKVLPRRYSDYFWYGKHPNSCNDAYLLLAEYLPAEHIHDLINRKKLDLYEYILAFDSIYLEMITRKEFLEKFGHQVAYNVKLILQFFKTRENNSLTQEQLGKLQKFVQQELPVSILNKKFIVKSEHQLRSLVKIYEFCRIHQVEISRGLYYLMNLLNAGLLLQIFEDLHHGRKSINKKNIADIVFANLKIDYYNFCQKPHEIIFVNETLATIMEKIEHGDLEAVKENCENLEDFACGRIANLNNNKEEKSIPVDQLPKETLSYETPLQQQKGGVLLMNNDLIIINPYHFFSTHNYRQPSSPDLTALPTWVLNQP